MESTFDARLYDGRRAQPRAGKVLLRDNIVQFDDGTPPPLEWDVNAISSIERVADGLHLELRPTDGGPTMKLVVEGRDFESQLDQQRALFDLSASRGFAALMRRLGARVWLIIAIVIVVGGYFAYSTLLPHAHVLISKSTENALGDAIYEAFIDDWDTIEDEEFDELMATMVTELGDSGHDYDLRVTLIDEDQPNAFALPGGRIVVFAGLLRICPSPDALAGVLAHEIVHVEQRHGLKHMLRSLGLLYFAGCVVGGGVEEFATAETIGELSSGLLILKHSRDHELEADSIAVDKLQSAGRSPGGLAEFFQAMQGDETAQLTQHIPGWLSTHPLTADRIARVPAAAAAGDQSRPWLDDDAWELLRARIRRLSKNR